MTSRHFRSGTTTNVPAECEQGYFLAQHPWLTHYLTGGNPCTNTGSTGRSLNCERTVRSGPSRRHRRAWRRGARSGAVTTARPSRCVTRFLATLRVAAKPNRLTHDTQVLQMPHIAAHRGAGATGLEPATSGVTGRRSNQLSYAPVRATVWHPPLAEKRGPPLTGKHCAAVTATGHAAGVCRRRQPYSQEVGPVPKCMRRVPIQLVAALAAAGVFTATAVAATIDGDDGPNRLKGTPEADVIQAFGGDDRVLAFAGNDRVLLGAGDDRTFTGPGDDETLGGPGDDRIRSGAGNDSANGEAGQDRLVGGPGDDALQGRAGDDRLFGGIGNDALTGDVNDVGDLFSHDRLWGGAGDDTLRGGDARDFVHGGAGDDTSFGESRQRPHRAAAPGNDSSDGGEDNDRMRGGPGDDTQAGGPGNDRIFANLGRDVTDGGDGDDDLWALLKADVSGPGDLAGDVVRGGGRQRPHPRARRRAGRDQLRPRRRRRDPRLRRRDRGRLADRSRRRLRARAPRCAAARSRPARGRGLADGRAFPTAGVVAATCTSG